MARTRTTIRRVDPWSVLKFGFVANIVLLGVYLLVGAVAWAFVRRLQLIETICDLARSVGYQECAVDGQALFDTMLVLGLLGVVIQTGVFVFLAFLANLIFDLIGGIAVTLEDDRPVSGGSRAGTTRRGVGSTIGTSTRSSSVRSQGTTTSSGRGGDRTGRLAPTGPPSTPSQAGSSGGSGSPVGAGSGRQTASRASTTSSPPSRPNGGSSSGRPTTAPPSRPAPRTPRQAETSDRDDGPVFGGR